VVQRIAFVGKKPAPQMVAESNGFQFAGIVFAFIGGTTPNWKMKFYFCITMPATLDSVTGSIVRFMVLKSEFV
jgi:hypothetical protein